MFNIFEQPWTLLITAAVTWRILDALLSDRHNWPQWFLLLVLTVASYGAKLLAETTIISISTVLITTVRVILATAIVILLLLPMVQPFVLRERNWWLWLLPPGLAVAAFAFEGLVKTDLEKINALIRTGMRAVEAEDCSAIEAIISVNYADLYHDNKESLMAHCRRRLSEPVVDKNKKLALQIQISPSKATVTLTVLTIFDKKGYVYRDYFAPSLVTKLNLHLQKRPDKNWLISSSEVLEINHQPASWRQLK